MLTLVATETSSADAPGTSASLAMPRRSASLPPASSVARPPPTSVSSTDTRGAAGRGVAVPLRVALAARDVLGEPPGVPAAVAAGDRLGDPVAV